MPYRKEIPIKPFVSMSSSVCRIYKNIVRFSDRNYECSIWSSPYCRIFAKMSKNGLGIWGIPQIPKIPQIAAEIRIGFLRFLSGQIHVDLLKTLKVIVLWSSNTLLSMVSLTTPLVNKSFQPWTPSKHCYISRKIVSVQWYQYEIEQSLFHII